MSDFTNYFKVVSAMTEFNETNVENARDIFEKYRTLKVIDPDTEFDDDFWKTSNETSNIGFHFKFSKGTYDKYYKDLFGMNLDEFIVYVKTFICTMLGRDALSTLAGFLADIRKVIQTPIPSIKDHHVVLTIRQGFLITDFLLVLPADVGSFAEALEYYSDASYGTSNKQRTLADFESYFLLNDIIKDYWNSQLPHKDRMFFFPFYLWWNLTAVIPQRPCEFLLTPRDCVYQNAEGEYFMDIRRNVIKGRSYKKSVGYKIAKDYALDRIKIPVELAMEIQQYITLTSDYEETSLGTLFIQDPHYHYFKQSKHSNTLGYLTYVNMYTILKRFFKDIVQGMYGYKVIYGKPSGERLDDDEICFVHLGDARHIAMINILLEGGSPLLAMHLAGQASLYTSGHYFTNIHNLIKCVVHQEYNRITSGNRVFALRPLTPRIDRSEGIELMGGGKCYSEAFAKEDYSHCLLAIGPNSEIGYCPNCVYQRDKNRNFHSSDEVYLRNLESDCNELERLFRLINKGKCDEAELEKALMKVQTSAITYANYLKETYEENNH